MENIKITGEEGMWVVGKVLNSTGSICDDSTQTFNFLLHLCRKVVMGVVGAELPSACDTLQLSNACLHTQSTASCHHSSPGQRGQHYSWQKAPPQLWVLPGPPHMDSHTHAPNSPQASGPPPLAEHRIPHMARSRSWGEVW